MVAITTSPTPQCDPRSAGMAGVSWLRLVDDRPSVVGGRRLGIVALVLVLALAFGYLLSSPPVDTSGAIAVQDAGHVVADGETMWSIANAVAPAGEAATYVERLVAVNGSATVRPGQVLELPVP